MRGQLSDLQSQKTANLDEQIKEIQDAKQGRYGKLQSLIAKRDELASQDTPEQTTLRDQIQKNDYALRDLAPNVSDAYRKANDFLSSQEPTKAEEVAPEAPKEQPTYTIGQDGKGELRKNQSKTRNRLLSMT